MTTSVVSRFFYKRLLLAHFKNRSKHNTLRIYYIDNKRAVVFVKTIYSMMKCSPFVCHH